MNELEVVEKMQGNENVPVINSREVAKMLGKQHAHLCRDIANYSTVISTNPKLDLLDFFIPITYNYISSLSPT